MITTCEKCGGLKAAAGETYGGQPCRCGTTTEEPTDPMEAAKKIVIDAMRRVVTESALPVLMDLWSKPEQPKTAHCCPACVGRGNVPAGFYNNVPGQPFSTSSLMPEPCRACSGTGIVWG